MLIQDDRNDCSLGPCLSINNSVHNNSVTYLGPAGVTGATSYSANGAITARVLAENTFDYDAYHVTNLNDMHWIWQPGKTWAQFKAAGQEAHGAERHRRRTTPTDLRALAVFG